MNLERLDFWRASRIFHGTFDKSVFELYDVEFQAPQKDFEINFGRITDTSEVYQHLNNTLDTILLINENIPTDDLEGVCEVVLSPPYFCGDKALFICKSDLLKSLFEKKNKVLKDFYDNKDLFNKTFQHLYCKRFKKEIHDDVTYFWFLLLNEQSFTIRIEEKFIIFEDNDVLEKATPYELFYCLKLCEISLKDSNCF